MTTYILLLVFGFVLLIKGADFFIDAAASIAQKLGISELIIGLTLVAFGTSVPELASSFAAASQGETGLIIGNIVGSNVANMGLILGLAAFLYGLNAKPEMFRRDGFIMLFVSVLFFAISFDFVISMWEASAFLFLYFVYTLFLYDNGSNLNGEGHLRDFVRYFFRFHYAKTLRERVVSMFQYVSSRIRGEKPSKTSRFFNRDFLKDLVVLICGLVAVVFGADFLITGALYFADYFSISATVVGLTVIAIGTSLPEVSVSIAAAKKGFGDIAVGNILGSNIANILFIGGAAGLVAPLEISASTLYISIPCMIAVSVMLLFFMRTGWYLKRIEGVFLLLAYLAFMVTVFVV